LLQQNRGCPNPGYKCGLQLNLITMINQKRGLLSRVRIVLTALVMLTGIGTTLMAMKPMQIYKYTVESDGANWRVVDNITDLAANQYECENSESVCTVNYSQALSTDDLIPKNAVSGQETGTFRLINPK
jgi:hypothetical protein